MSSTSLNSNAICNSSESEQIEGRMEKLSDLKIILGSDLLTCDAKLTLFVSTASSYRYDTQLKPFPPKFVIAGNKCDIEIVTNINETPALNVLLYNIETENYDFGADVIELVHWVLIQQVDPCLRTLQENEFDDVLTKVPVVQKCLLIYSRYVQSITKFEI